MKNKLLVTMFATMVAFAFIACENKSDVADVCEDMAKESIHKSTRCLVELKGKVLTVSEYEFLGGVNDNRLLFRTVSFGDSVYIPTRTENMTYEYGEWNESNTGYSLYVTPSSGDKFTLWYKGNAFYTSAGSAYDQIGARVEKWEKTLKTFPCSDWEATYRAEYVLDSVFRDSIRATFVPPMSFKYDTLKIFDHMDTLSADTTSYISFTLNRDNTTLANTGHYYQKDVRSTYNRETQKDSIISQKIKEYDFEWYFSDVSSDSKFKIVLKSVTAGEEGDLLDISKYKTDSAGIANEFLRGGLTYTRPVHP